MARREVNTEALTCAICLELLREPVTIPCGHSFCRSCVQSHWNLEQSRAQYSCPECRQSFRPRPVLGKNIKMAALLEQMKETGRMAGPGDVPCDVCSGRKLKAVRSCLQCLVSYCERHLQPHRDVAGLQRHQLVAPTTNLQEYVCSEHNEVKKMFCRSDQQLLCVVCCMDQHKGHDTVSSAGERGQRQVELEDRKQQLLKTISESETDLRRLQEEAQDIRCSAQDAVQRSGDSFTQMIRLLKINQSHVERLIRIKEESELRRVQQIQDQVQLDITQRKKTLSEMNTLLYSSDHSYFLQLYSKLPSHGQTTPVCTVPSQKVHYFGSVITAVSALRKKIKLSLTQCEKEVSKALTEVRTLLSFRNGFLKYACDITLDPNTAHNDLCLTEGNRRVTNNRKQNNPEHHPDRFIHHTQVLSREALTGRCYWEVEWSERFIVVVLAVAYRDIVKSSGCFGYDDQSWALNWYETRYEYKFNDVTTDISGPVSSTLGVFLDHSAGLLSFYSVKDQTLSLIHRVHTTFTQPLHVGVNLFYDDVTVYFPKIKCH